MSIDNKMQNEPITIKTLKSILVIIGVGLVIYTAYQLKTILLWVVIGAFLAIIINPAVSRLSLYMPKRKRGLALTIVLLAMALGLAGLVVVFITPLIKQTIQLVQSWPTIMSEAGDKIRSSSSSLVQYLNQHGLASYLESQKAAISSTLSSLILASLNRIFAFVNNILSLFTIIVIAIYMSLNGPQYYRSFIARVPKSKKDEVNRLVGSMYRAITGYINGNLLTSFVAGVSAGLLINGLGIPYAAILGLIVAITDLIPLIGAQLGALIVIVSAYFQSPSKAIIMTVFFVVYQSFENYILSPKIMSRTVSISPILVFLFVICGATLAGFVGALIAIPTGACIMILGNYLLDGTIWEVD